MNNIIKTAKALTAAILFILSGRRIKTPTAKEYIRKWKEQRAQENAKIQQELDDQHNRLRGWTSENYSTAPHTEDRTRNRLLEEEFTRTHKLLCA